MSLHVLILSNGVELVHASTHYVPFIKTGLVRADPDVIVRNPCVGKASRKISVCEGSVAAFNKAL